MYIHIQGLVEEAFLDLCIFSSYVFLYSLCFCIVIVCYCKSHEYKEKKLLYFPILCYRFTLMEVQFCNELQNEDNKNKSQGSIKTLPNNCQDISILYNKSRHFRS